MSKIFWIDEPIKYSYRDFGRTVETSARPGWFYSNDDHWSDPYEGHKKELPHFEISVGDKLLTRNGSIMKVGPWGFGGAEDRPIEAHFWFFKDASPGAYHDSNNEGTLAYYDKYLNHRTGNHIDKNSGYDIIGPYDDKDDKCPCCQRRYDGRKD